MNCALTLMRIEEQLPVYDWNKLAVCGDPALPKKSTLRGRSHQVDTVTACSLFPNRGIYFYYHYLIYGWLLTD
jgi:hypothetical protein